MEPKDVLLARQPIYDRKLQPYAYELLFRPPEGVNIGGFDGNMATSQVLLNALSESDLATVSDELPAFVNFTRELILNPPILPVDKIVIEVLEDIEIDSEIVAQLRAIKAKGFKIALDDFVMDQRYAPLFDIADIVKLELPDIAEHELEPTIRFLKAKNLKVLAEKIETQAEYKRCKELGCDLFQGYFLSKPEIVKGKKLADNQIAVMNLIAEIQQPDVDIPALTKIITSDPSLSVKLLKIINSAAYRRSSEIESIHKAVMLMGIDRIKSWVSLLALGKLDNKPTSLHNIALVRALMCESLGKQISPEHREQFYTVGLFSCLDAFFDAQMADVMGKLDLNQTLSDALISFSGLAGLALHTTINFEQCKWREINWPKLKEYEITSTQVNQIYYESTGIARDIQKQP